MDWLSQAEAQLTQAKRAFRQDPTPALASAMKRLAGAIKYERRRAANQQGTDMEPIDLEHGNYKTLQAALASVNGRYTTRTFNFSHQIQHEITLLEVELSLQLRLPSGVWNGIAAVFDSLVDGPKRAGVVGTRVRVERRKGRWFMTAIERSTDATEARNTVYLPKHLADRTMAEHRQRFEVLDE